MGLKFLLRLRLQVIPFCFHVAENGGEITCDQFHPPSPIKVIKSDGAVEIYDRPVNAAEVMSLVPKHLVCRSDSFYIGQRIPALSPDDRLLPGQKYFLLPNHFFQDDLSFVAVARLLLATPGKKPNKRQQQRPFDVQRAPNGALRVRVSEEYFVTRVAEAEPEEDGLCTTEQLKKDYSSLVGSTRQWKPKLETIRESSKEKNSNNNNNKKKKKRKISYTSSFKFRTCKSHKTSSSDKEEALSEKDKDNGNDNYGGEIRDINSSISGGSFRVDDDDAIRDIKVITTARKKGCPSKSGD